jgi:isoamylase
LALRDKQKRNFLATLFLSQGVPMLLGGDELGRTQGGNNNGYCQDNEISWFDWENADEALLEFTRNLIRFRSEHPVFMRRGWFLGRAIHGGGVEDIGWFTPEGIEMAEENWGEGFAKSVAVFLNGGAIAYPGPRGEKIVDDSFLVLFNAHYESIPFTLPGAEWGKRWIRVLDTAGGGFVGDKRESAAKEEISVQSRSLVLLRRKE